MKREARELARAIEEENARHERVLRDLLDKPKVVTEADWAAFERGLKRHAAVVEAIDQRVKAREKRQEQA